MPGPDRPDAARTVIRRPGGGSTGPDAEVFHSASEDVLRLASALEGEAIRDFAPVFQRIETALDRMVDRLKLDGVQAPSVAAARFGLLVRLDVAARRNPDLDLDRWAAGAQARLFQGRDVSLPELAALIRKAHAQGAAYQGLTEFLEDLHQQAQVSRTVMPERKPVRWGAIAILSVALVIAGLAAGLFFDWRHDRKVMARFEADIDGIPLAGNRAPAVLARALDLYADAARRGMAEADEAPAGILAALPGVSGAGDRISAQLQAAVSQAAAGPVTEAVDAALATEGEGLALYDSLRARAVLGGQVDWSPDWIAGWIAERPDLSPAIAALGRNLSLLTSPPQGIPPPDPATLEQARGFAAEATEAERAFLELLRAPEIAALEGWVPTARVPALEVIMVRRSGTPLSEPVPGIHTTAGWAYARDIGSGVAVQEARRLAPLILQPGVATANDTPDQVMALLQERTLDTWSAFLSDLRVRPFSDPDTAVLISGTLSRTRSPLSALLEQVWEQSGGLDRTRPHELQIRIATRFGPMIQFVEQGRMSLIANLFGALNVALGTLEADTDVALDRLMNVQERATSIAALQQAPPVVGQIVEDVLAQTAAAHGDTLTTPVTRIWANSVLPECSAIAGTSYPFGPGPDIALSEFADLLGPGGTLDRFFQTRLAHMVDTSQTPWRWKPEAAISGLNQDSAAFFQRVASIRQGYFADRGLRPHTVTVTPLAERGSATLTIAGANAPLSVAAGPVTYQWPGPQPDLGTQLQYRNGEETGTVGHSGPWGFLRLLEPLRLRVRNEGARFLVDLREEDARFFFELDFDTPQNPVAARGLLRDFTCPATL